MRLFCVVCVFLLARNFYAVRVHTVWLLVCRWFCRVGSVREKQNFSIMFKAHLVYIVINACKTNWLESMLTFLSICSYYFSLLASILFFLTTLSPPFGSLFSSPCRCSMFSQEHLFSKQIAFICIYTAPLHWSTHLPCNFIAFYPHVLTIFSSHA